MKHIKVLIGAMMIILLLNGCVNDADKKEDISAINSILLNEKHPVYYGNLKDAKNFSENFSEKTVVVDDQYSFDSEKTLLYISGYDNSIRDIQIYLDKTNERVTEKKGLKIANSYLPKDILKKYYSEPSYEKYIPKDTSKSIFKVISYGLTEYGHQYYEKEHKYQGAVTVIFEEYNQEIKTITITFDEPRWMFSAEMNGYTVEEWKINDI